ncbi:MAG TPA: glucoamylase family protein, partial [Polyangiaceae bacterium]
MTTELSQTLDDRELDRLQLSTVGYYLHESNPGNGLVRDKTEHGAPASIAAIGLGLATIPVLIERAVIDREFASELVLKRLRFFRDAPQGVQPDATGYRGFYYHFLHMKTGRRVWDCELSTLDSAFLFAGMLTCATYFDDDSEEETEVRRLADELYRRADWKWALAGGAALSHGWRPETGFIPHAYRGYDEALLAYLLGLGSPTFPLPVESYAAYCATYQWKRIYDHEVLYSGPLFTHQLSHLWVDFRGIQDAFMR